MTEKTLQPRNNFTHKMYNLVIKSKNLRPSKNLDIYISHNSINEAMCLVVNPEVPSFTVPKNTSKHAIIHAW